MATPFDVALVSAPQYSSLIGKQIRELFGSAERAFKASAETIRNSKLRPNFTEPFLSWRGSVDLEKEWASLEHFNLKALAIDDPLYPPLLREIHDPPHVLFVRGTIPWGQAYAVVGSRLATPYGLHITETLMRNMCQLPLVLVSGLARGIDTKAHETALAHNRGTIAVLAGGHVASMSARERRLAARIIEQGGAVISERPFDFRPQPYHFPIRNRIIAGIASATVVIEGARKSGSLATAYSALRENRDVFAVPGPITSPVSGGTNLLLKQGANPFTETNDLLGLTFPDFLIKTEEQKQSFIELPLDPPKDPNLVLILETLNSTPQHTDELQEKIALSFEKILAGLSSLELTGHIRTVDSMYYVRTGAGV